MKNKNENKRPPVISNSLTGGLEFFDIRMCRTRDSPQADLSRAKRKVLRTLRGASGTLRRS